jgi:hypothetical protein
VGSGQAAFEAALKLCKSEIGGSKNLLPGSLAWFYPLSLLAQATPKHLELARKFCVAESGKRAPSPYGGWGRWVHAIDVRLGKIPLERAAFRPTHDLQTRWALDSLWAVLLAAWLGHETIAENNPQAALSEWRALIDSLRQALNSCRLTALMPMLDGSQAVLEGRDPPENFFHCR